jgi:hypothetical protein
MDARPIDIRAECDELLYRVQTAAMCRRAQRSKAHVNPLRKVLLILFGEHGEPSLDRHLPGTYAVNQLE